jgi:hypothetical protein
MATLVEFTKTQTTTQNTHNHHYSGWSGFIARYKAKRQARKIMRSLEEAHQIHAGKKQAKTFDDFLDEL